MKIKIPVVRDEIGGRSMKYCLYHPKIKADRWTGHLILGKKVVFIGYCTEDCSLSSGIPQGCSGNFKGAKV